MSCLRQAPSVLSYKKPSRQFSTVWLRLGRWKGWRRRLRTAQMLTSFVRTALESGVRSRSSSHSACVQVGQGVADIVFHPPPKSTTDQADTCRTGLEL